MRRFLTLVILMTCGTAHGQGYLADVEHSATSVLLPVMCLRATDDSPAGSTYQTGLTASSSGLEIKVRTDNTAGWLAEYAQAASTINNKTAAVGTWETPDANDAEIKEVDTSEGCYQLDLPDSTWSVSGAKYVQIKWSQSTIADTMFTVNLNVVSQDTLVDAVWDEPCAGHTTTDTPGDNNCDEFDTLVTNVSAVDTAVDDLTDGTTPVWPIGVAVSNTADSGTTTSITDTELSEADTDYWSMANEVIFTSGSLSGQARCVTGFTPGTDTLTFYPAVTQSVGTHNYVIRANAACSVNNQVAEDQDGGYSVNEILSVLLSEAVGTCTYTSGTRTWACSDPSGTETRFSIVYGTSLDGTRTSSTATPATP